MSQPSLEAQFTNLLQRLQPGQIADTETASAILSEAIRRIQLHAENLDTVSIPGFGSFVTQKHNEQIIESNELPNRTAIPPRIAMEFKPSVLLRKKFCG